MVDKLLTNTKLLSKDVYTAISTVSHTEVVSFVSCLNQKTSIPNLLVVFGSYLLKIFSNSYSRIIEDTSDVFTLIKSIHNCILLEIRKLYPDAELSHFDIENSEPNTHVMNYYSNRKMSDLAYGLLEDCLEYFGEKVSVPQEMIYTDGGSVKFVIVKL
jgi:hypothetical protein